MQLLVRVVDKTSDDPAKHIQLTKRGDVIVVKPDGADWGARELDNPDWRIIQVPDMSADEAEALLAPEVPPLDDPEKPVMKRAFRLNVDNLNIDTPRSKNSVRDHIISSSQIKKAKELKSITANPNKIGKPFANIIGPK